MNICDFKGILWDYTRKISKNMNNTFCPICEQHGLTMMQVKVLAELNSYGSHTVGSLADSTSIAGTNISAMCKKLEGKGFLKRVRNQEDERVVRIALTQMGKEIVLEIDTSLNKKFLQLMEGESEETLDDIIKGLQKLNTLLQKISKV
jgi:DNA-binding MarR family transcriptional regulator